MPPAQNLANHANRPVLSTAAGVATIVALGLFIFEILRWPSALTLGLLFLTSAVMILVVISRVYVVRLQDRIIRLEMRVRLARLGHGAHYDRLTTRQLIALRFASDSELPGLLERAITENLTSRQIKEAVRDWQPDYHRT
jgi:hypothetical protein